MKIQFSNLTLRSNFNASFLVGANQHHMKTKAKRTFKTGI